MRARNLQLGNLHHRADPGSLETAHAFAKGQVCTQRVNTSARRNRIRFDGCVIPDYLQPIHLTTGGSSRGVGQRGSLLRLESECGQKTRNTLQSTIREITSRASELIN